MWGITGEEDKRALLAGLGAGYMNLTVGICLAEVLDEMLNQPDSSGFDTEAYCRIISTFENCCASILANSSCRRLTGKWNAGRWRLSAQLTAYKRVHRRWRILLSNARFAHNRDIRFVPALVLFGSQI